MKATQARKLSEESKNYSAPFLNILTAIEEKSRQGLNNLKHELLRMKKHHQPSQYSSLQQELNLLGYKTSIQVTQVNQYLLHITGEDKEEPPFYIEYIDISW
jgi:hypothetical protein